MDQEQNKTPPHNLDAEQAFLGALLYDADIFDSVSDWFKPEYFYDPVHQRIYSVLSERIARGQIADVIALKSHFEGDGTLTDIGGTGYLATLLGAAADSAAAIEYAKMVYDLAMRRDMAKIGRDLEAVSMKGDIITPAKEILEGAERQLFALAETGRGSKGFVTFKDALTETIARAASAYQNGGKMSGLSTGLRTLDDKLGGLNNSDLIILAGRPSMGKSSLVANIAFHVAKRQEPVGFFSLEMSYEQISTRLLSDYAGIASNRIRRGEISPADFENLRDAAMEIQSLPLHIDDTGGLNIATLCARARRLKRMEGIKLLIIDYLQLATGSSKRGENRVQEVSEITQALKALAKELNIPVIALSQLSRQVEQRPDKKPQLSDLRESGSIEQDADVVMFVYREAYYKEREKPKENTSEFIAWQDEFRQVERLAEVIIGKQRHGPIGTVQLAFDGEFTRFSDLARGENNY